MSKGKITPNTVLHFNKKTEKDETSESEIITLDNLIEKVSSDNVSDAMKNLYGTYGLIRGVKPVNGKHKVSGFIKTVETGSNDWGTCISGIYECEPGEVLVIKCSNEDYAVWGGLASSAAMKHGIAATVVIGATRDTNDILDLDFPVFSSSRMSRAGLPSNNGIIGEDLLIDEFIVKTGDFAVCDADGVVIIPQEKIEEVLIEVSNIKKFEEDIVGQLFEEDKHLDDILGL